MDKNTKKIIVVIIVAVISIVCAVLGISLGVPIETLIPIGTEIIGELADAATASQAAEYVSPEIFSLPPQPNS
ncbi:MAG: hypothetical protein IJ226_00925 [Clostridia bacterium]|nr:hypothetical protein [Clostridia bacterium]